MISGTVSIILPCYNVAPYLNKCLGSLAEQSWEALEIICVNDGSTDDTLAVLRKWAEKDSRIRVVDQENGGSFSARNAGLDAATGEYLGFVDPDDYVHPSMYARLVETARRHDADVAACGYASFSDEDGAVMEDAGHAPAPGFEPDMKNSCFSRDSAWLRMDMVLWNKVYKRSFLQENSLRLEPGFRGGEDDVFWLMTLPHASRVAVIPDQLYFYRRKRAGSLSDVWDRDGWLYSLDMDRLEHVAEYWKRSSWTASAMEHGWLAHVMKRYLLSHVSSAEEIFQKLDEGERRQLAERYRKWLRVAPPLSDIAGLNKWDGLFCLLLRRGPVKMGLFSRLYSSLMASWSGRRGRFHRLRLLLSKIA